MGSLILSSVMQVSNAFFYLADCLQRLSPYLKQNPPLDILDLWPGDGIWSSQVNEYLRPRRHVMIEPQLEVYGPFLQPLAKSKECYKLASGNIHATDWLDVFRRYLPEQECDKNLEDGPFPRNNSLLVLAKPPAPFSAKDHNTPARWWSAMMEGCMLQTGIHIYGSVRILAAIPITDMQAILPRTVFDRKRPALLTENVALHTIEIASAYDPEPWHSLKTWDSIQNNYSRVAERAAANGVITPPGREAVTLQLAPDNPKPQKGVPYHPRARTEGHDSWLAVIQKGEKMAQEKGKHEPEKVKLAKQNAIKALSGLKFDNRTALVREELTKDTMVIDGRMRDLCRAAADTSLTTEQVQAIDTDIANLQSNLANKIKGLHFRLHRGWERHLDDARIESYSNDLEDSVLLWDKRPFEPLRIEHDEVFPMAPGAARTLLYFEPDAQPSAMRDINKVAPQKREELMQLFEALSITFGTRHQMTITELTQALFPSRSTNELVKLMPGLIKYAAKRIKPNCGPVALPDPSLKAEECFQENIDYDLSESRLRCVSAHTLWEILLEYQKHALDLSSLQFVRLLGGTLTSFRAGDYSMYHQKKLH